MMNEKTVPIGEKIRDLRKKRGLTQADLAGDRITRNMICLIENGAASPSVETLVYIAERLGVPAGVFLPRDRAEEEKLNRITFIDELRRAYRCRDYTKCVSLSADFSGEDDEISYILAASHLGLAVTYAEQFSLDETNRELDLSETYSKKTVYCGKSFEGAIKYYRFLLSSLCTDEIPAELCDMSGCGDFLPPDIPSYFSDLRLIRSGETGMSLFRHTAHRKEHLDALGESMEENYQDALRRLRKLADDETLPYYMLYRVLSDLENAADLSGNIRLAYNVTRQKLSLIDRCRVNGR